MLMANNNPRRSGDRERGAVSIWIIMMLPVVVLFLGISWDAGNLLAESRRADQIARSTARAASHGIDQGSLYLHQDGERDGRASVNEDDAKARASAVGEAGGAKVVELTLNSVGGPNQDLIEVTVTTEYEPTFLAVFGYGTIEVEGKATIRVRSAINTESFNNDDYRLND